MTLPGNFLQRMTDLETRVAKLEQIIADSGVDPGPSTTAVQPTVSERLESNGGFLSEQQLADGLGLGIVEVQRTLAKLVRAGLVEKAFNQVVNDNLYRFKGVK